MQVLDFIKLCKEWHENFVGNTKKIKEDDISFDSIKFTPLSGTWTPDETVKQIQGPTRKVSFTRGSQANQNPEMTATIHATKAQENIIRVILTSKVISGLVAELQLPLDDMKLPDDFGTHVTVNPSQLMSEERKENKKVSLTSSMVTDSNLSALVRTKTYEYQGSFQYKIAMTGSVQMQGGPVYGIVAIIRDLICNKKNTNEMLNGLSVEDGKIVFTLEGIGEFSGHCETSVEWI